ncbi:hypothetical protein ACQP2T_62305 [Nonomuraea sp. CA-143628]|uniref:hypothetical protein n=1 Tax=Nonomuraea sp. CA-143628 TaxID=3239997 RepID=UPI003D94A628
MGPSERLTAPLERRADHWWLQGLSERLAGLPERLRGLPDRWRVAAIVPLALFAVAAAAEPPSVVDSVQVDGDQIIVLIAGRDQGSPTGISSVDGGVTWSAYYGRQVRPPQTAACVPGQAQRCYRVLPGRPAVAESDDGGKTWRPSWSLSDDQYDRLARRSTVGPRSLALAVQARPGGHVVVVADGLDGVLVRDVAGTWRRVGWPEPLAFAGDETANLDPEQRVALVLAALMLLGAVGTGMRRLGGVYAVSALVVCVGLYAMLGADRDPAAGVTALGAMVCFLVAIAGQARGVTVAVGFGAAPLVYAAVYMPFYGWAHGMPGSYAVAVGAAVVMTAGVVAASGALIRRDLHRRTATYSPLEPTQAP